MYEILLRIKNNCNVVVFLYDVVLILLWYRTFKLGVAASHVALCNDVRSGYRFSEHSPSFSRTPSLACVFLHSELWDVDVFLQGYTFSFVAGFVKRSVPGS